MPTKHDLDLQSAKGSAEGWRRIADREQHGKLVAQARARWLEELVRDAKEEARRDGDPEQRLRMVLTILGRTQPPIRIPRPDTL